MINPYYYLAAFVVLSIYNINIYLTVGWANVALFILQGVLFSLFLFYGGAEKIKTLHQYKSLRRLIFVLLLALPSVIGLAFFGGFVLLPLCAFLLIVVLYFLTNICPHCDHFLKSGKQDILWPRYWFGVSSNSVGIWSPINPPNCLNCGERIKYK